jgi:hypothetical protein
MKYLISKAAAELEGVTVREIERRAAAGEVRTQKSATPARNRTYPMMCDVRSLSAAAQQKFMQHKLSGAELGRMQRQAPGGQLARTDANQRGELTTPSSPFINKDFYFLHLRLFLKISGFCFPRRTWRRPSNASTRLRPCSTSRTARLRPSR